ncbi:MAG: DUF1571 domain-containing protein [Fuerstiella sp.]|nr:DUF1571 domain-containing protein [Fuerstiella sp.]
MLTSRKSMVCLLVTGLLTVAGVELSVAEEAKQHPLIPALRVLEQSLKKIEAIPAYRATVTKTERVNDRMVTQKMKIKFRREPFSVYLYFLGDYEGREVIYVEGSNNGKLLVHETGLASFAGTLRLAPNDSLVMSENRHPITELGIEKFLLVLRKQWIEQSKYTESSVKYFRNAKLGGMTCRRIVVTHPRPRRQFPFHKTVLWIDDESGLAVRLQQFGFAVRSGADPPIVEDYTYTDLRPNVRISDRDFDENNPKYNY